MTVALELLRTSGVVTVPGNDFGNVSSPFLRMNFASAPERMVPGLERLAAGLERARRTFEASERPGLSHSGSQATTVWSALG